MLSDLLAFVKTFNPSAATLSEPPLSDTRSPNLAHHIDVASAEQRVLSPDEPTVDAAPQSALQTLVAILEEQSPLEIEQRGRVHAHANAVPDRDTIAPNIAFPSQISPAKTRPDPPLTRSRTAANSATIETALNLAVDGTPLTYAKAIRGKSEAHWRQAEIEEFDRLFASNTMKPIQPHDQPACRRKDTSYYNPQIKEKEDSKGKKTYRVRGTIGGDRINYPGDTAASTAAMPVVKILLQSAISDDSNWMAIDIIDYYLNTPLFRPVYIRIQRKLIPSEIIRRHKSEPFMHNNSVLFEVNKGMYGLP